MQKSPLLRQFRFEIGQNNIGHLIFDAHERSMNVFSDSAIDDLAQFAAWLKQSELRGVVISSGKASGFCAGADLTELGTAYDMIMQAPPASRFQRAFDHFFRLSQAIRALETSGKPVAAAVAGLALGGGCELAMGAHYRVLAATPKAVFGLPESLVGLLPGGGGTQRLPRLIGLRPALDILLEGGRLGGGEAVAAGLADQLVPLGEEVAAAEHWVLNAPHAQQPWDRPDWQPAATSEVAGIIGAARGKVLAETLGHYPAPMAILDCLERGLPCNIDEAIRIEMEIFAVLIQRAEARDMIGGLFLAKLEHDRLKKSGGVPEHVRAAVTGIAMLWRDSATQEPDVAQALAAAGFKITGIDVPVAEPDPDTDGYWFERAPLDWRKQTVQNRLTRIVNELAEYGAGLSATEQHAADYLLISEAGFPAFLGGPFSYARQAR